MDRLFRDSEQKMLADPNPVNVAYHFTLMMRLGLINPSIIDLKCFIVNLTKNDVLVSTSAFLSRESALGHAAPFIMRVFRDWDDNEEDIVKMIELIRKNKIDKTIELFNDYFAGEGIFVDIKEVPILF